MTDYGTEALMFAMDRIDSMTSEEYEELYDECCMKNQYVIDDDMSLDEILHNNCNYAEILFLLRYKIDGIYNNIIEWHDGGDYHEMVEVCKAIDRYLDDKYLIDEFDNFFDTYGDIGCDVSLDGMFNGLTFNNVRDDNLVAKFLDINERSKKMANDDLVYIFDTIRDNILKWWV